MNPYALRFPIHLSARLQSRSRWIGMTKWVGVGPACRGGGVFSHPPCQCARTLGAPEATYTSL